jgi:hypothetical protein
LLFPKESPTEGRIKPLLLDNRLEDETSSDLGRRRNSGGFWAEEMPDVFA